MIISMISAMDKNRLIGINNTLPWNLPADMKHFRKNTRGKPVLMGRKTYESIGKPLPNRLNIILTKDQNYHEDGCIIVHSIEDAISFSKGYDELMVIGGSAIYEQLLPYASRLYLTMIDCEFCGDVWFPEYNKDVWLEVSREDFQATEGDPYNHSFVLLERLA